MDYCSTRNKFNTIKIYYFNELTKQIIINVQYLFIVPLLFNVRRKFAHNVLIRYGFRVFKHIPI